MSAEQHDTPREPTIELGPATGTGPDALIGAVLNQTYRIERLLSHGGMGTVFAGRHVRLPRAVAIKVLRRGAMEPDTVSRFEREAHITCALRHPNIVDVLDFGRTADGTPFIVMELLEGEDLATRIERDGPLPVREVIWILRQAVSALETAHEADVIHRDLKPSNLFLCRRRRLDHHLKLMDFGVSKVARATKTLTRVHASLGTPCYMSPEQAAGRSVQVDRRTDVFSLGLIVHEMLTGRPAFLGANIADTLYRVVYDNPAPPCTLRPDLPPAVDEVVGWALSKPPEQRPASVSEFGDALVEALLFRSAEMTIERATDHPGSLASSIASLPARDEQATEDDLLPITDVQTRASASWRGDPISELPTVLRSRSSAASRFEPLAARAAASPPSRRRPPATGPGERLAPSPASRPLDRRLLLAMVTLIDLLAAGIVAGFWFWP